FAERKFDNFRGLNRPDKAWQYAEHATLSATRHHPRRRRLGIQTPIARPAEMWGENARLAFEAEDRTVDVGFLQQHARVISQIARRKIVGPIHHEIIWRDDVHGVLAGETGAVEHHF